MKLKASFCFHFYLFTLSRLLLWGFTDAHLLGISDQKFTLYLPQGRIMLVALSSRYMSSLFPLLR